MPYLKDTLKYVIHANQNKRKPHTTRKDISYGIKNKSLNRNIFTSAKNYYNCVPIN